VKDGLTVRVGEDHVATVEFDRPPHNHFDVELIAALANAYAALDEDPACRAILLCSAGRHFCAGANFAARGDAGAQALYSQAVRDGPPELASVRRRRRAAEDHAKVWSLLANNGRQNG
jgi:enoyl-CoA hydratase/carnithine racemase